MATPVFQRLSLDQFSQLLARFPFTRRVNAVHMHHTRRPARREFRGHETIVSMWRFDTQQQGWRDIAQHLTIDPEGFVWLGRNWNLPPVSASGHNGNAHFGPFMLEMIGNFDRGCDPFDGPQRETALEVVAQVQARFGLPADSLVFHNAMSSQSCPGNALDLARILDEIERRSAARARSSRRAREAREEPFPDESDHVVREAIEASSRIPAQPLEPGDAEPSHDEDDALDVLDRPVRARQEPAAARASSSRIERAFARGETIGAEALAALRPHLVNLNMGRFSNRGEVTTTQADVDAIFEQSLPRALEAARAQARKLRIVFYAHGGLVSESSGLRVCAKHVDWWKRNDVYPIHFVWETGLFETIGQLLTRAREGATRGIARDVWDHTLDPLIEAAVRTLQGARIWAGMKSSAERAFDEPGGGGHYVASRLKTFCDAHRREVELHAVGHSAGSIFHSHFLATAHDLGVPTFESAQFLAPAVALDTFRQRIGERLGERGAVRRITLFTMQRDYERDDDCAGVYHKSLLYLVSNALESERGMPLLGLEESLRADDAMKRLFGLGSESSAVGDVVWSVSASDTGASASSARTHGAFDDDAPTMNSVARRVLGKADADPIVDYATAPDVVRAARPWVDEVDWPTSGIDAPPPAAPSAGYAATTSAQAPGVPMPPVADQPIAPAPQVAAPQSSATAPTNAAAPANAAGPMDAAGASIGNEFSARRSALCIGIDRYPDPRHRLAGCASDARMWSEALTRLGFATTMLTDAQATREAIDRALKALVAGARPGDLVVFQYSGHGTHLPDLDTDEEDREDEAICPVDFASGALYIDDDIAQVIRTLPDGVGMTCFMDCCHSGTNTRFAVGAPNGPARSPGDERRRFVAPTPELVAAHRRFRRQTGRAAHAFGGSGTGGRSRMRDVKFAACLDGEVAWESDGHGEFTLRATSILAEGIDGLTNEGFVRRVGDAFGPGARQHPMLDCSDDARSHGLLQPRAHGASIAGPLPAHGGLDDALLLQTLSALQQLVHRLGAR